ncbi:MAG: NAD(P)H-dependent oxidoreductase subunit E [Candidatus Cloacimonetes bacterium]|nr:NAD(P)H-dependent oxidoreductase subunit E [Candidatus Cloacimonadota bacterium]
MAGDCCSNNALYTELEKVIADKSNLENPLIEILREAQELFGYLPEEVQQFIAEKMRIPVSEVYGVVTFYNFFSMKPRGKYVVNVCTGTACFVKGAQHLLQMLTDELGVELGETTPDNQFTLSSVRCVGACSLAPVFVIGEDTYGRIENRESLKSILAKYRDS